MATLLVARADGSVLLRIDLSGRRVISIGRSPRCELTIGAASVSRRHALLFRHANGWRLTDTGSRLGLDDDRGNARVVDLTTERWCRIGTAYLWLDPTGAAPDAPRMADFDEASLLSDPDREPGPVVTIVDPSDRPLRRIALREHDGLVVGSAATCDVVVKDRAVAPMHAVFYREQTRWCVAAADGEQPLLVDGRRRRRRPLHGGLVLSLGGHRAIVSGPILRPGQLLHDQEDDHRAAEFALEGSDAPDASDARGTPSADGSPRGHADASGPSDRDLQVDPRDRPAHDDPRFADRHHEGHLSAVDDQVSSEIAHSEATGEGRVSAFLNPREP